MVGLELWGKTLVRVANEMGFMHQALLEGFEDVGLDVVRVEAAFTLVVFLKLAAHVLFNSLFLAFNLALDLFIGALFFVVFGFNISKLGAECAQFFYFRCKSVLLFFALDIDLLDQGCQFLQRATLGVVQLLLQFRNTLDLVFDIRVSRNTFFLFKVAQQIVNITSAVFEDLLGAVEHCDFRLDLVQ